MTWQTLLNEAVRDDSTGMGSSTRIVILIAGLTLSLCTLVLTVAVLWNVELVPALSVFGGALGGMAGTSYVAQRAWSPKRHWTDRGNGPDYEHE